MSLILNTTDADTFESTGRADADRLAAHLPDRRHRPRPRLRHRPRRPLPRAPLRHVVGGRRRPAHARVGPQPPRRASPTSASPAASTRLPAVPDASSSTWRTPLLVLQHLEREDAFLLLEELRRIVCGHRTGWSRSPTCCRTPTSPGSSTTSRTGEVANPARARMYTPGGGRSAPRRPPDSTPRSTPTSRSWPSAVRADPGAGPPPVRSHPRPRRGRGPPARDPTHAAGRGLGQRGVQRAHQSAV